LQREMTDSTVIRNIGVPFGHTLIAVSSTMKGLDKLIINRTAIEADLEKNWAVVAEAIQTILRREAYPNPYEALKKLTRTNQLINREVILDFIDGLDVDDELKAELRQISPHSYTGIF
ncbi:MAG: adenylosuccinate lyase, partial [Mangrovibacterium sp.]|nr:adenylosuccinate lyase [Mangrovibacterium sp.]